MHPTSELYNLGKPIAWGNSNSNNLHKKHQQRPLTNIKYDYKQLEPNNGKRTHNYNMEPTRYRPSTWASSNRNSNINRVLNHKRHNKL